MAEAVEFEFRCGDLPESTFSVVHWHGEEGISRLYWFRIELASQDPDLDIARMQREESELVIRAGGEERRIQGILSEVDVLDHKDEWSIYRVTLVPAAWELTQTSVNAVHLGRTTPEIIERLLEQHLNVTNMDFDCDVARSYPEREFRLQYGESHWAFLSRHLERDGVYYLFRPGERGERIAFCDATDQQPALDTGPLQYTAGLGLEPAEDAGRTVHSLVLRRRRMPERVRIQNYDDEEPSTPILEEAEVDGEGAGEVTLYGQNVKDPAEAREMAEIRAQELGWPKVVYHGESTVFQVAAGHRFDLEGHPRGESNREYQLVEVSHRGVNARMASLVGHGVATDTPTYENSFTAIPADVQYRAPRVTEWPRIQGSLNAVVDAEGDGRYAELDSQGRYRIVFPFHEGFHDSGRGDRGKASHWVRLVQPYGGTSEGMHFPLRAGARVLVGFIGGNPDLPVISGTLPTREQPSVCRADNLAHGVLKSPCGNLLEFDDEHPRIKLETPCGRSYFHIGASNADGEGVVSITDGISRSITMGGSNAVTVTDGWPEGFEDHYPALTSRFSNETIKELLEEDQLGASQDEMTDENHDNREAKNKHFIDWGKLHVFDFPKKHNDASPDDELHEQGETSGRSDVMVSRTIGVQYSYRHGIDYAFRGHGCEAYDFGPSATFSSDRLQEVASDMRGVAVPSDYEEGEDSAKAAQDMAEYRDARKEYYGLKRNDASPEALEALLVLTQKYGSSDEDLSGSMLWVTEDEAERLVGEVGHGEVIDMSTATTYGIWLDGDGNRPREVYESWYNKKFDSGYNEKGAFAANLENIREGTVTHPEDRPDYLKEAEEDLEEALPEYKIARTAVSCFNDVSYRTGASYSETHVDRGTPLEDLGGKGEEDLADEGGHSWGNVDSGTIGGSSDWEPGKVNVAKTFGNSYSYTEGHSVSATYGDSYSVTRTRKQESKQLHPRDGHVIKYSVGSFGAEGHEAGWHEFETNHVANIKATTNLSLKNEVEVNIGHTNSVKLNLATEAELTLSAAASYKTTLTLALNNDVTLRGGAANTALFYAGIHSSIRLGAGLDINVQQFPSWINITNDKTEVVLPGLVQQSTTNVLEAKATEVQKRGGTVTKQGSELVKQGNTTLVGAAALYNNGGTFFT